VISCLRGSRWQLASGTSAGELMAPPPGPRGHPAGRASPRGGWPECNGAGRSVYWTVCLC